jgi:hypothetical protein
MRRFFALFCMVALTGVVSAHAGSIIAYTDPASSTGQVDGGSNNFALAFSVNAPITVTALGLYDYSGNGVINGPVQVTIFQNTGGGPVTPVVTFAGTYATAGDGYDVFQSITPVVLGPGSYLVDEFGLNADGDWSGNLAHGSPGPVLNDGGGLLSFGQAVYDASGTFDNPAGSGCGGCEAAPAGDSQFDAGTFEFQAASVSSTPEPPSFLLLGTGLLGLAGLVGRKLLA